MFKKLNSVIWLFYLVFISCNEGKEVIDYYDNSKVIFSKGNMKDGKMTGEWIFYYRSGKIESIEHFKGGNLIDEYKEYYENGTLKAEGEFDGDTICTSTNDTTDDGQVITTIVSTSCKTGTWKYYDSTGKITLEKYETGKGKN